MKNAKNFKILTFFADKCDKPERLGLFFFGVTCNFFFFKLDKTIFKPINLCLGTLFSRYFSSYHRIQIFQYFNRLFLRVCIHICELSCFHQHSSLFYLNLFGSIVLWNRWVCCAAKIYAHNSILWDDYAINVTKQFVDKLCRYMTNNMNRYICIILNLVTYWDANRWSSHGKIVFVGLANNLSSKIN